MRCVPQALIAAALILFGVSSASTQVVAPLTPGTRTISVSGHGDIKAKPDELIASFSVDSKAATGAECTALQSEKANKIVDSLKAKLNGKGDVQTSNFSLNPYNESIPMGAPSVMPTPTGIPWNASIQIQAMADRLEDIGPAIQAGMAAGADRVMQSGVEEVPIDPGSRRIQNSEIGDVERQNIRTPTKHAPWVNLEVQVQAATPSEAVDQCTQSARRVEKAVAEKLGPKGTVRLEELSIMQVNQQNRPYYQMPPQPQIQYQTKQSFSAHTNVNVTTRQIALLGPLIEAAMAAGASQLDSVSFTLSSDAAARNDAIAAASKDAQSKAQVLATSMNVKLGKALGISINAQPQPRVIYGNNFMMHSATASMVSSSLPVLPREVGFGADVNVVYEIH
ncbi:MAG TPA: SIMPL domain-containing protein [Candidatus Binataceae bacterium]|nr:SIMPL domain-containing protein [Candidatus Binataceae bacterium]